MNPNILRQWMQVYDREFGDQGNEYVSAPHGAISQIGAVPVRGGAGNRANRFLWAERMAQQQAQAEPANFFADAQASFVRPEQFNERMPDFQMRQGPMRPQVNNFLARLMGARNAR